MATLYLHKIYCLGGNVGLTTSVLSSTTVDVDASTLLNIKTGDCIKINDGVTTSADLLVTNILGSTVTVEPAVGSSFASGSTVIISPKFEEIWLQTADALTQCPRHHSLPVNPDSAYIADISSPQEVRIIQSEGNKNRTKLKHVTLDIPANGTAYATFTWNADVAIRGLRMYPESFVAGDEYDIVINKGYSPGLLGAGVGVGLNQIVVSPDVITYVAIEDNITLTEGGTTNDLGCVTAIDMDTLTLTVQNNTTNSFTTSAGVIVDKYLVRDAPFPSTVNKIEVGGDTIAGTEIPKGSVANIIFRNSNPSTPSRYILNVIYMIGKI